MLVNLYATCSAPHFFCYPNRQVWPPDLSKTWKKVHRKIHCLGLPAKSVALSPAQIRHAKLGDIAATSEQVFFTWPGYRKFLACHKKGPTWFDRVQRNSRIERYLGLSVSLFSIVDTTGCDLSGMARNGARPFPGGCLPKARIIMTYLFRCFYVIWPFDTCCKCIPNSIKFDCETFELVCNLIQEHISIYLSIYLYIYLYLYVRSQWGRYNLPRYIPYIIYIYVYVCVHVLNFLLYTSKSVCARTVSTYAFLCAACLHSKKFSQRCHIWLP